ncbi:MAG: hypothetical protein P8X52_05490 [Limibacillus sp.]
MARFTPRGGVLLETRPSASRVRLRLLTRIRWVAVVGQAGGLLAGQYLFGITLPLLPAFLVVAVSTLLNLLIQRYRPSGLWLGDREAALYLGYDLLQLGVLLSLTGGLTNPFAILILAPITVSASLLSRSATLALSAMGLVAVSLLALVYIPLPWHQFGVEIQPLYLAGLWGSLVIAIVFIAAYVYSMSSEAQTLANALRAAELALEREQRLSAVGALAAAAAHELGTPLSTIALIAKELERGAPDEDPGGGSRGTAARPTTGYPPRRWWNWRPSPTCGTAWSLRCAACRPRAKAQRISRACAVLQRWCRDLACCSRTPFSSRKRRSRRRSPGMPERCA